MKRTLESARRLARGRGHEYLGTEHLILALLDDTNGIAGSVIHRLGYTDAIRSEVTKIIDSDGYAGQKGSPPPPGEIDAR
jgi:ATP-dependent Clp protease ATP-binding subunit ClpC